ncbi:hypothetical protein F2P81_011334 [Scophthalmus maximus]|uniref:Nucleolar protein 4 helical domain-containing protein n=1 Tax=Scophthalmus maximus TaxID=52904 RepID=A0A6A4T1A3_SCOMX|nr:hypothetical protein F2P81_011334 [Scophthalmus maximus]
MNCLTGRRQVEQRSEGARVAVDVHARDPTEVEDDSSLSSEEEAEMSEPTWLAPDLGAASDLSLPSRGERMRHSPQTTHSKEDDVGQQDVRETLQLNTTQDEFSHALLLLSLKQVYSNHSISAAFVTALSTSSSSPPYDRSKVGTAAAESLVSSSEEGGEKASSCHCVGKALMKNDGELQSLQSTVSDRHLSDVYESMDTNNDSSSESGSGNGLPVLTPPSSAVSDGAIVRETKVVNGNGGPVPLDFSTPTSSSSSSEDQQPMNLSDPPPQRLPLSTSHLPVTVSAAAAALLGALHPNAPEELRRKYPLAAKPPLAPHPALPLPLPHTRTPHTHNAHTPNTQSHTHTGELRLDQDSRDYGGKMFVRLFVDENLDRMVPISKQPKEKIQAIIESCSRQFPEFQERARKRIRTYLKSCRRMKKNGMETRPTPPHLTSAMAENILAAACESESRNAAKRMRLEAYHDDQISLDKPSSGGGGLREPASLAHSAYSLAASAFSSQDAQLYINGAGLSYGYRGYPGLGAAMQHPVSLTTSAAAQSNGPTDLSMKSLASANIINSSSSAAANSLGGRGSGGAGGGGASTQLSQPEITAVRQLIAGYRESAAFLLRSADELENLILQQN